MSLRRIKSGSEVFIDANIFIYHFTGVSDECTDFLLRCEEGDITGITSVNVILEVLHRLMMIEAVRKRLVKPPDIVKKLQKNPGKIKRLSEYFINTQKILEMNIEVKPISFETILKSHSFRVGYGLMVNDSLIVATMYEEGIRALATNDSGFKKIDGLSLFSPTDVSI